MDIYKTNFVYLIRELGSDFYKIGRTNNIQQRLSTLQTGNPRQLILVDIIHCLTKQQSSNIEKVLHRTLLELHTKGEWFLDDDKELSIVDTFTFFKQSFTTGNL
jgi:hypothetical protein